MQSFTPALDDDARARTANSPSMHFALCELLEKGTKGCWRTLNYHIMFRVCISRSCSRPLKATVEPREVDAFLLRRFDVILLLIQLLRRNHFFNNTIYVSDRQYISAFAFRTRWQTQTKRIMTPFRPSVRNMRLARNWGYHNTNTKISWRLAYNWGKYEI